MEGVILQPATRGSKYFWCFYDRRYERWIFSTFEQQLFEIVHITNYIFFHLLSFYRHLKYQYNTKFYGIQNEYNVFFPILFCYNQHFN